MKKLSFKMAVGYVIMVLILFVIVIAAITANNQGTREMHHVVKELAPQLNASMEIKLTITEAHLWFEEVMSGAEPNSRLS